MNINTDMKVAQILYESTTPMQPFIWHITESSNVAGIMKSGLTPNFEGKRGPSYADTSLFFITSLDPQIVEEIEMMIRFGGTNMDDDELMNTRNDISLSILKVDIAKLKQFDYAHSIQRIWKYDLSVSNNKGIITNAPVPNLVISLERNIR